MPQIGWFELIIIIIIVYKFNMSIGFWQIAIVVILVVLLFGRGKISDLMGDVAKGIKSFKKGMATDITEDSEPKNVSESNQDKNDKE